jgi:site-specific recombinase XerC
VIVKRKAEIAENKYLDIRKEPEPIKFNDFAKEYKQWAKTNKKPSTCVRELCIMRSFDKEFEGKHIHEITGASNLVMQAVDLKTVRELLGHRDLKMTLRCVHLAPGYKAKAANVLGRVFDLSQNPPQTEKVVQLKR